MRVNGDEIGRDGGNNTRKKKENGEFEKADGQKKNEHVREKEKV
jgi:hypothetical protein